MVLDEFQHSRTLKGPMRTEVDNEDNRQVWELIDSGKIEYYNWHRGLGRLNDHLKKLKYFILNGVTVENGLVINGWHMFQSEFNENADPFTIQNGVVDKRIIDTNFYENIFKFAGNHYDFTIISQLEELLLKMNSEDTVCFFANVLKIASKPQIKNFTKTLIFIIENLDEAYVMSGNLSADIDADTFYEASLKITVPQIKRALASRFRNEQISRLGNIHIIYPALSKKTYQNIILRELDKVKKQTAEHLGLELFFDELVRQLIYKDGVFPTQDVRPLITTINYIIKTNLPVYFSEILMNDLRISQLKLSVWNKRLICDFISECGVALSKGVIIETPLEDIRISKKDDLQAITAVHESGHAIISAILLKVVPDHVFSVSTEFDASGFVFSKFRWNYVAKQESTIMNL